MPPRVRLRPPTPADRDEFVSLARASEDLHRPWVDAPDDASRYEAYLERAASDDADCSLLVRVEDGALVGVFNLSQIVYAAFRSAYLGFYAFAPHAGRGYMSEGMGALLDHAFDDLALHRVEANVQPGNQRSQALVTRCGFRHEGFSPRYLFIDGAWRDHDRFAITVEERPVRPG